MDNFTQFLTLCVDGQEIEYVHKGEFSIEQCIGLVKIAPSVYESMHIY